ncbi:MAG: UDP-N-acetylmuramoylalanyl-D-glutamyl-2,6-diaminopimelate--D-alanyl-D-alanine ligase [Bauldia sp.]|nr:UDP-N-acetylmuramoylalanyl-D-glutamyl-2,6-diaminopimelate--D-alanyl-D-alanine ligase [Bauldia sp.]
MTGPLWSFAALVEAVGGRTHGPEPAAVTGISIDSRTLTPGDAFFAIAGDKFDGHRFVSSAMGKGAATAIVAEDRFAGLGRVTGSLVLVKDVLEALRLLGRAARARTSARIVAVTGSTGKTSTKDMLMAALGGPRVAHGAPASFNNHWGVPLTLARMPADAPFAVFEIGMNHAGEIAPLSRMVQPHVAIVTNVEPVHLAHFASVDEIAAAKAEIFAGLPVDGIAILNRDNARFDLLAQLAVDQGVKQIVSFGAHPEAHARLEDVVLETEGSTVSASILGHELTYSLSLPGRHMVENSLAVLAAAILLGREPNAAAEALATHRAGKGRGEQTRLKLRVGEALLIDESYNANPASMRAALALLGQTAPAIGGKRLAVLGDMLELGSDEAALHAGLAEALIDAAVDQAYLAGPRMRALWEALPHDRRGVYAESAQSLESVLAEELGPGDVVMIKGSNATGMGSLVDALKRRFAREGADLPGGQGAA